VYTLTQPTSGEEDMLTGKQCQAARVLVECSRERLAQTCSVDAQLIRDFEHRILEPGEETKALIRGALEEAGAAFIPEDESGGAGVRLRFSTAGVRAIRRWEGEGGLSGDDDV
jgi:hypothetical protein